MNALPQQYLSTSHVRDQANIDFLAALVPNPFRGLLPGTASNAATVARSQLLRPFPQFGNVRTFDDNGTSSYNSAQFKVEKRFTKGYTVLAAYTRSKFTERVFKLNPYDTTYENRLSGADVPNRLTLSGIWELPFGHGRAMASNVNRLTDGIIGGWRSVDESGCEINIEDDGTVKIYSVSAEGMQIAREAIESMTAEIEVGKVYRGKVVTIKEFGCFVEIFPGKDGLVHISELANFRVKQTEDIVKVGDEIWVKCIGIDDKGRVKLSRRAAMEERDKQMAEKS